MWESGERVNLQWCALYVGKTQDFSSRISTHESWQEAVRLGATDVHAMEEQREQVHDVIEKELISWFRPRLNVQGK